MHSPSIDEYSCEQQMREPRHTWEEPRSSSRVDTSAKSAPPLSCLQCPYLMLMHAALWVLQRRLLLLMYNNNVRMYLIYTCPSHSRIFSTATLYSSTAHSFRLIDGGLSNPCFSPLTSLQLTALSPSTCRILSRNSSASANSISCSQQHRWMLGRLRSRSSGALLGDKRGSERCGGGYRYDWSKSPVRDSGKVSSGFGHFCRLSRREVV